MKYFLTAVVLTAGGLTANALLSAQVTRIPTTDPTSTEPRSDEDVKILMQAKLARAHDVLEGLVTQDFEQIETAAAMLSRISLADSALGRNSGDDAADEVYEHFRLEFARLAGQLRRHAHNQELEATAYVQQNLTATCVACHDHIRDNP